MSVGERLAAACAQSGLSPAIRYVAETDSTNDDVRALALLGEPNGTALVAGLQRAGRGRLGRKWESAPGSNLLLSVLIRERFLPAQVGLAALATAVGVAEACGAGVLIKWPNDLVDVDGRKLGGILAEAEWQRSALQHLVIGVGLNLSEAPPGLPATTLSEVRGGPVELAAVAVHVVAAVRARCAQAARDPEAMLAAWRARAHTLGREVAVGEVRGLAVDVDVDGALCVKQADGQVVRVLAGDVSLVASAPGAQIG